MLRSMFAAISGLKNHQTFLDVIGNNLANVNTVGYKASRVTFQDILSQTMRGASGGEQGTSTGVGGTNAIQIGLGMALAGVDNIFTAGQLEATNNSNDLALQGDGFFVLTDGSRNFYSRDGSFGIDTAGILTNMSSGLRLVGWITQTASGAVDTTALPGMITVPTGGGLASAQSTKAKTTGNLDSATAVAGTYSTTMTVYDSLGNARNITLTFTKSATNQWDVTADEGATSLTLTPAVTLTFTDGTLSPSASLPTVTIPTSGGAAAFDVNLDFDSITQMAKESSILATSNGAAPGSITTYSVSSNGEVRAVYSNGVSQWIGQLAIASFANPTGLVKQGSTLWDSSPNSGVPELGLAGTGQRGQIAPGFLEMSNVDLAQEFTNMIIASRGFQANSRVISTADQMLQDLVNLIR
ncbi:MAG: flagellar hook protein FlgE [Chloroflexi bacterium]|nr:flagellar hook protein FlgE [Chloroflexota bacterium]